MAKLERLRTWIDWSNLNGNNVFHLFQWFNISSLVCTWDGISLKKSRIWKHWSRLKNWSFMIIRSQKLKTSIRWWTWSNEQTMNSLRMFFLKFIIYTSRMLDISFNRIGKIENLDALVNLEKLFLCSNKISIIDNLSSLCNLTMLELGDNKLRVNRICDLSWMLWFKLDVVISDVSFF